MAIVSQNVVTVEGRGFRARTREWAVMVRVVTNSRQDTAVTVATALPAIGTLMSAISGIGSNYDTAASVTEYGSIRLQEPEGDGEAWLAELVCSTAPPPEGKKNPGSEGVGSYPWEMEPQISLNGQRIPRPVPSTDKLGRAVKNSAGDPFDDTIDGAERVLRIHFASLFIPPGCEREDDVVNDGIFFGKPAGYWKSEPSMIRQLSHGDQHYYDISVEFRGRPLGWRYAPIDRGPRDKNKKSPADGNGVPVYDNLALLDGAGEFLAIGLDPYLFDGNGGRPNPFTVYEEVQFGVEFHVPTTWLA